MLMLCLLSGREGPWERQTRADPQQDSENAFAKSSFHVWVRRREIFFIYCYKTTLRVSADVLFFAEKRCSNTG